MLPAWIPEHGQVPFGCVPRIIEGDLSIFHRLENAQNHVLTFYRQVILLCWPRPGQCSNTVTRLRFHRGVQLLEGATSLDINLGHTIARDDVVEMLEAKCPPPLVNLCLRYLSGQDR